MGNVPLARMPQGEQVVQQIVCKLSLAYSRRRLLPFGGWSVAESPEGQEAVTRDRELKVSGQGRTLRVLKSKTQHQQ